MKKKILAALISGILTFSCAGCSTTYQEATGQTESKSDDSFAGDYFTTIVEWGTIPTYRIVYANDTKVKYFVFIDGHKGGISPLYNADGSLQLYEE